jgi:hypothetical protein
VEVIIIGLVTDKAVKNRPQTEDEEDTQQTQAFIIHGLVKFSHSSIPLFA